MTDEEVRKIVKETVTEIFMNFGIPSNDPFEMQKDMQHLRSWRIAGETIRRQGIITAVVVFVTGAISLFWVSLQHALKG